MAEDHKRSNRTTLPIRALNEVYIGEYVASGTSYFEMQVNQEPINKHKSSGKVQVRSLVATENLVAKFSVLQSCCSRRLVFRGTL